MILKCAGTDSSGNSYALISDSGQILLIECGVNWKKTMRMIDYQISNVVGCIASHAHQDHLKEYKKVLENWIPIYTNDETAEGFEIVTGELMKGVPEKKWFQCGEFSIMSFYVPHTTKDKDTGKIIPCPNFGYLVQHEEMGRLLYMTDLEYCPYSFKNLRVQHLLIECNYITELADREAENYRHRLQGHCSLDTCKGIVEANKTPDLRTVTLIHLSDMACDPDMVLKEIKSVAGDRVEVNVAVPGLAVELKKFPF